MHALALVLALAAAPSVNVSLLEARTHPDTHWYGERAYLFRANGITAKDLDGHTVTWTLDVRRKLGSWKGAPSWLVSKSKADHGRLPDIAFGLIYRSMAKAHMQPGEHVARFVATDETGKQLFSGEVGFLLPATGSNAYDPRSFSR